MKELLEQRVRIKADSKSNFAGRTGTVIRVSDPMNASWVLVRLDMQEGDEIPLTVLQHTEHVEPLKKEEV